MKTQLTKLNRITSKITKGTTPTTMGFDFIDYGVNYIKAEALNGDSEIDMQSFSYISADAHNKLKRSILQHDDVLVTIAGVNIGKVGIVKQKHLPANTNQAVGIVRAKSDLVNSSYLYYWFKNPSTFEYLQSINSQAAQPNINLEMLGNLSILLPDIQNQQKIALTITAYDDLINTNRRRIQLLEESARLLFREWFVYFKFPGHEKVKLVDRGGKKMPAEWEYLPFTKIKLFKKAPLGVPVFTDIRQYCQTSEIDGTSITGDGEEVDYENRPSRADITPRIYTVYFAKMKDTDKVLYFNKGNSDLLEKILLSTGMVGFTTDEKYLGFLFGLLTSYEFVQYKNNFATGATQVSLNDASLKKIKVLFPALKLVELYSEIVNPLLEECSLLRSQNQRLAQARDLLLPRLMSGEIEV